MFDNSKALKAYLQALNDRDWAVFGGYLHPEVMRFIHEEERHVPVATREDYLDYIMEEYKDSTEKLACARTDVSASGQRIAALLVSESGKRVMSLFDFEDGLVRWQHDFILGE